MSKITKLIFTLEHLRDVAIIEKPCTGLVKCKVNVLPEHLYVDGRHNRWIVDLYAVTKQDMKLLKKLAIRGKTLYTAAASYFLKGVIWENTVVDHNDLPIKKENMLAVFDYIEGKLRCINLNILPKTTLTLYNPAIDLLKSLEEM